MLASSYNHRLSEANKRDVNVKQFEKIPHSISIELRDSTGWEWEQDLFLPYVINPHYVYALTRGSSISRRPESYSLELKPWIYIPISPNQ